LAFAWFFCFALPISDTVCSLVRLLNIAIFFVLLLYFTITLAKQRRFYDTGMLPSYLSHWKYSSE
jgi:hypothetical protein